MDYVEMAPAPELAPFVLCYWMLEGAGVGAPEVVLPDGRMELIVHYGDPFPIQTAPGALPRRQACAFLAGQISRAIRLTPPARTGVCGVRFRYAGAAAFLRMPVDEFSGCFPALDDLWSRDAAQELSEKIAEAAGARARAAILDHLLTARLHPRPDSLTDAAVRRLAASGGRASISSLAREAGWTPRHLTRRFRAQVGLTPKLFARILRFQNALRGGAAEFDAYYDQSHFIRDCRQFTGCTPTGWSQARREIMSHFSKTSAPEAG